LQDVLTVAEVHVAVLLEQAVQAPELKKYPLLQAVATVLLVQDIALLPQALHVEPLKKYPLAQVVQTVADEQATQFDNVQAVQYAKAVPFVFVIL